MASGLEIRAQIDTETVRALLVINGGGAVALLALVPAVIDKSEYRELVLALLVGVAVFMVGLVSAVVHNRLRRKCSLVYEQHAMRPPAGRLLGIKLGQPVVCWFSIVFMWVSIASFFLAGSYVAFSGYYALAPSEVAEPPPRGAFRGPPII